jgi:hypothetical protein
VHSWTSPGATTVRSNREEPSTLPLAREPTAIVCFNDLSTISVVSVLRERRPDVPRDVSITDFVDTSLTRRREPEARIQGHTEHDDAVGMHRVTGAILDVFSGAGRAAGR